MPISNKPEQTHPTYQSFLNRETLLLAHWYLYPFTHYAFAQMMESQLNQQIESLGHIQKRYIDKHPELFQDDESLLGVVSLEDGFMSVKLHVENSDLRLDTEQIDDDQLDDVISRIAKFDTVPFTLENVIESFELLEDFEVSNNVLTKSAKNLKIIINQTASPDNTIELLKINRFINKYTHSPDNVNTEIDKALKLIENNDTLTVVLATGVVGPNEIKLRNLTEPAIKTILEYENFEPSIDLSQELIEHIEIDDKPLSTYMGVVRNSPPAVKSIDDIPEDAVVVEIDLKDTIRGLENMGKPCDYLIINGAFDNIIHVIKSISNGMVKRNIFGKP